MSVWISQYEQTALYGLPHIQQLLYCLAIRPFMDYNTCIVGLRRGISYQSLSEALFVEPHPGYRHVTFSQTQIRRAVAHLEKVGLLEIRSTSRKLIFFCPLAARDKSARKKADSKPTGKTDTLKILHNETITHSQTIPALKAGTPKTAKADTPQKSNNHYFNLYTSMEKKHAQKKRTQHISDIFTALSQHHTQND